jgi:hypothetical protein
MDNRHFQRCVVWGRTIFVLSFALLLNSCGGGDGDAGAGADGGNEINKSGMVSRGFADTLATGTVPPGSATPSNATGGCGFADTFATGRVPPGCATPGGAGSGGGGGASITSDNAQPPGGQVSALQTITTTVTVNPGNAGGSEQKIVSINTGFEEGRPGQALQTALDSNGDAVVIATDADNNIILAGIASTGTTTLNAESTAIALARIALGPLPETISASQANAGIRNTRRFNDLTKLISRTLADGKTMNSDEVVLTAGEVAEQAAKTLNSRAPLQSTTRTVNGDKLLAQATVTYDLLPPLPLTVIGPPGNVRSVNLTRYQNGSVDVANSMQIYWEAFTSGDPKKEFLAPVSLKRAYWGNSPLWFDVPAVTLVGNPPSSAGAGFTVTVQQSRATRAANLSEIMRSIIGIAFPWFEIEKECSAKIVSTLLGPSQLDLLVGEPTPDRAIEYFKTFAPGEETLTALGDIIKTCTQAPAKAPLKERLIGLTAGKFVASVAKWTMKFASETTVEKVAGVGATMYQTVKYWSGLPVEVRVCEEQRLGLVLVACPSSFVFEKSRFVVPPSFDPVTPEFHALTVTNVPGKQERTGIPVGVVFASSDEQVVRVDKKTGALSAPAAGSKGGEAVINVFYPFTGATGQYTVLVSEPVLTTPQIVLTLGSVPIHRLRFTASDRSEFDVPYYPTFVPLNTSIAETFGQFVMANAVGKTRVEFDYIGLLGVHKTGGADVEVLPKPQPQAITQPTPVTQPQPSAEIEECQGIAGRSVTKPNNGRGCYLPLPNSVSRAFNIIRPPQHGTLAITSDRFLYTPTPGYIGNDSVTVTYSPITNVWSYDIRVTAPPQ